MYIACIFTNIYEEWTDNFPVDFQDSLLSNWGAPKRWHCPLPPGGYLQVWCHDGRLEEQSSPENPKIFHHTGGTWDDEMERLEAYVCWVFVTGALFVLNFPQITRKKKKTRWWLDGSWKRHLVKDKFKRRVHFGGRNYPVTWLAYKCYLLDHHHSFSIGNQDHDLTVHLSMLQSVAVNKLRSGDHVHTNFQ